MFLESKELSEQVRELADMHGDMTIAFYDRVEKQIILGAQPEYLDWEAEAGDNDRWRARIKAMGKDRKRAVPGTVPAPKSRRLRHHAIVYGATSGGRVQANPESNSARAETLPQFPRLSGGYPVPR